MIPYHLLGLSAFDTVFAPEMIACAAVSAPCATVIATVFVAVTVVAYALSATVVRPFHASLATFSTAWTTVPW
jgi:hypothetical protein